MVTLIKGIIMAESTKERILRTALELFAQNGYLGTSMNDIAGQLGFTKAALYKRVFLVVELIGSTCFATMIENKPDTIDNMKPVLYDMVRKMLA